MFARTGIIWDEVDSAMRADIVCYPESRPLSNKLARVHAPVTPMHPLEKHLLPNREGFAADPFGYSALAWYRWAVAQNINGLPVDPEQPPTARDLKSPVLWLSQAHALSEAAVTVLRSEPNLNEMPVFTRGVCDSQYCAVGLMLVGYSLEVCLKAMLIIRNGIDAFAADERSFRHHRP